MRSSDLKVVDWKAADRPLSPQDQLDALVRLVSFARTRPLSEVLEAVGDAICAALGFRTAVVNVYAAATHEYKVATVSASEQVRAALSGTSNPYDRVHEQLLVPQFKIADGVYFVHTFEQVWDGFDTFTSPRADTPAADRWQPEDALLVVLEDSRGQPLGLVSLDDPADGKRPTPDVVAPLVAIAQHASVTLETFESKQETERHARALSGIAQLGIPSPGSAVDVCRRVCSIANSDLGFRSAAVLLDHADGRRVAAARGWDLGELDDLASDTSPRSQLSKSREFTPRGTSDPDVLRDGHGPRAWGAHRLTFVLRDPAGPGIGTLVVDRPADRRAITDIRLTELQLLADQAAALLLAERLRSELRTLAAHDPLTGLANRRRLEHAIADLAGTQGPVSAVLFDLDHFKNVNDTYGHDAGDAVLQQFADLLTTHTPDDGCAARLGGEEFFLLLPNTDHNRAHELAESIRTATPAATAGIVATNGQTVSAGVASAPPDRRWDRRTLLAAADRALYTAKKAGRNRVAIETTG